MTLLWLPQYLGLVGALVYGVTSQFVPLPVLIRVAARRRPPVPESVDARHGLRSPRCARAAVGTGDRQPKDGAR